MCRMIAFSNKDDISTLEIFDKLKELAQFGLHYPHSDGWGAYLKDNNGRIFCYKNALPSYEDEFQDFKSNIGIFHARKASEGLKKGNLQLHPIFQDNIIFSHNGTVKDIKIENPFSLDSYELLSEIKNFDSLFDLAKNVKKFYSLYSFTAINFFMIKFETLYVLQLYKEEPDYYTLWLNSNYNGGFLISSEAFDSDFKPLKNGDLLKMEDGNLIEKINVLEEI
jgi:predicted glutamine amidotransferase